MTAAVLLAAAVLTLLLLSVVVLLLKCNKLIHSGSNTDTGIIGCNYTLSVGQLFDR
jgi:hypothetical protein